MIRIALLFLPILALILTPASGAKKNPDDLLPLESAPPGISHITLDAHNVGAGRAQKAGIPPSSSTKRITTTQEATVEISVVNIGTSPEEVTLQWYWVGRYARSRKWFRAGEGGKMITADPRQAQTVLAEGATIEGYETRGKKEHYKSGGNMIGWIVTASNASTNSSRPKPATPFSSASPLTRRRKCGADLNKFSGIENIAGIERPLESGM
ncbi:MAG: hypothetical protein H0X40_04600 [Chthoniobacterales bacterium]|nr:hypothetical protein [Chthoniobacterales bacterium]